LKGASLSLDQAIVILCVAEAACQQLSILKSGDVASIQALPKSTYKKPKTQKQPNSNYDHHPAKNKQFLKQPNEDSKSDGCWNCGNQTSHPSQQRPANRKECSKCTNIGYLKKYVIPKRAKSRLKLDASRLTPILQLVLLA
jgi:uncharacterized protein YgiM (DUF1202 family)